VSTTPCSPLTQASTCPRSVGAVQTGFVSQSSSYGCLLALALGRNPAYLVYSCVQVQGSPI
jgi:hypothetical protein